MTPDKKTGLIDNILAIELGWFLTVNPTITSDCQRNPDAFKMMRGSHFETWPETTLALYLTHIESAREQGRNLVREKYGKMQQLFPITNSSDTLSEIVSIQEAWQRETREQYPAILRPGDGEGFSWYLRCELDTYSPEVLASYLADLKTARAEGRNLVTETYDHLARKLGHHSLDEWQKKKAA